MFCLEFGKKNYCHFRNQYIQVFLYAKFHAKIKNTYIYDKKCFILNFSGWNSKKPLLQLKLMPLHLIAKFGAKKKILKFLDWNFKKTIVIFEISTLEFVGLQNFVKK